MVEVSSLKLASELFDECALLYSNPNPKQRTLANIGSVRYLFTGGDVIMNFSRFTVPIIFFFLVSVFLFSCTNADVTNQNIDNSDTKTEAALKTTADDTLKQYPSTFFNFSQNTSLLKIKPLKLYGIFSKLVSQTSANTKSSQKSVIIEAEVEKDYYNNISAGEIVYVSFAIEFDYGTEHHSFNDEEFVKAILNYDSLVLYTDTLNSPHYFYVVSEDKVNILDLSNLCTCDYYRQGIIPIKNSIVDFTQINNLLNHKSLDMQYHFDNIHGSGYSIIQGDSEKELENTIRALISKKIYGG